MSSHHPYNGPKDHWIQPDQNKTTTQIRERAPDQEQGPRLSGNDGVEMQQNPPNDPSQDEGYV